MANELTLAEYAGLAGLKGVDLDVVHTIVNCMPIFDSAPLVQCNSGTMHKTQVVTSYPKGQTRGYNMGVKAEKATAKIVQDITCMTETFNVIDRKIVALNGNSAQWRQKQDMAFARGLARDAAERIFNASPKRDPFEYDGLGVRYNKIGDCVIDAGGTGNNLTDIWLVNWDQSSVHLIYPEGGVAGLTSEFEPNVDVLDKNGNVYKADRTWYRWDQGLSVSDPMQVIRVANVDIDKALEGATDVNLVKLLTMAVERIPDEVFAGCAIYMNHSLRTALRMQVQDRPNVQFTYDDYAGKKILSFDGIKVHKVPNSVIHSYAAANKIK